MKFIVAMLAVFACVAMWFVFACAKRLARKIREERLENERFTEAKKEFYALQDDRHDWISLNQGKGKSGKTYQTTVKREVQTALRCARLRKNSFEFYVGHAEYLLTYECLDSDFKKEYLGTISALRRAFLSFARFKT